MRHKNLRALVGASATATVLFSIAGATAVRAEDTASGNAVVVGGTPILRIRVGAGGYSPEQRADQVQARLNRLLGSGPISPEDVVVKPFGNEAVIRIKGQTFLTADWATARYNKMTPTGLAEHWAENLRTSLPSLTAPK